MISFHIQRIILSKVKGFYKKSKREIVKSENVFLNIKIMNKTLRLCSYFYIKWKYFVEKVF